MVATVGYLGATDRDRPRLYGLRTSAASFPTQPILSRYADAQREAGDDRGVVQELLAKPHQKPSDADKGDGDQGTHRAKINAGLRWSRIAREAIDRCEQKPPARRALTTRLASVTTSSTRRRLRPQRTPS